MTALGFVRRDMLPEHVNYRDKGCHVAPACLTCPLERCIYDVDRNAEFLAGRRERRALNRERIAALQAQGIRRASEIAARMGMGKRTVQRELQEMRSLDA